jgi:hypothetical protein
MWNWEKKTWKYIRHQKECDEQLLIYAKQLEKEVHDGNLIYKGKNVSDVSNKSGTLKSYLSRAQTAL